MELDASATSKITDFVLKLVTNPPVQFRRFVIENQSFNDSVDQTIYFMTKYSLAGNPIHNLLFVRNAEQESLPTVLDWIDSHCRVNRINTALFHWPDARTELLRMLRCENHTPERVGNLVKNSIRLSTVMESDLPNSVISHLGRALFTQLTKLLSGLDIALLEYSRVESQTPLGISYTPTINSIINLVKSEIFNLLESGLFLLTMSSGHQFSIKSLEVQRNIIIDDTHIVFSTIAGGSSTHDYSDSRSIRLTMT